MNISTEVSLLLMKCHLELKTSYLLFSGQQCRVRRDLDLWCSICATRRQSTNMYGVCA